jgi:murein DD-endopeptidase MepM/ murein hydrolase activator NlpD
LLEDIRIAENSIDRSSAAVARSIQDMNMAESESPIEELLQNKSLSDTFDYVNALKTVQGRVKIELEELRDTRMFLGAKKDQVLGEKERLESYVKTLSNQSKVIALNKTEKDKLLKDTQNKESEYKLLVAEKIKEREVFEKELFNYESQLKVSIDPSAIPSARLGVLSWPVDNVSITQYFGKTVAAKRLYTSGTHGGIDFKASIGTKIKTALSGTVVDTESVRTKRGCQYGKWVLIKHPNGLTTIYGHLSLVTVNPGDTVVTGDVIGYSGDTGYATGPHLHLGVYASSGVRIVDSTSLGSNNCKGIKTVAANPAAYLDPSAYLPRI